MSAESSWRLQHALFASRPRGSTPRRGWPRRARRRLLEKRRAARATSISSYFGTGNRGFTSSNALPRSRNGYLSYPLTPRGSDWAAERPVGSIEGAKTTTYFGRTSSRIKNEKNWPNSNPHVVGPPGSPVTKLRYDPPSGLMQAESASRPTMSSQGPRQGCRCTAGDVF